MIPTLEAAKNYIYSINFEDIIKKMVDFEGWTLRDANETCFHYRNFLFLKKKYWHKPLTPSNDLDNFWHNHILDTKKYTEDCEAIFGEYLHHNPYFGIDEKTDQDDLKKSLKNTLEMYFNEFGFQIPLTRSQYPRIVYYMMKKLNI